MIKFFSIGNSFSVDAMTFVPHIAESLGIKTQFANLYCGGCSIDQHVDFGTNDTPVYDLYTANSGEDWQIKPQSTMQDGFDVAKWDIISLQQVSGFSGVQASYRNLPKLIDIVRRNSDKNLKLIWNMTWAYQGDSTHPDFPKYSNNQREMYQAICDAVKTLIVPNGEFYKIIPTGTAIQNARLLLADNITRDGFHLSVLGRYVAGLMFVKTIFDVDIDDCKFAPEGVNDYDKAVAIRAVNCAYKNPFETLK